METAIAAVPMLEYEDLTDFIIETLNEKPKNIIITLEAECASQGLDWEEVLEQRAREKNKIKKMGLDGVKSNEKTVILEDKEVSGK